MRTTVNNGKRAAASLICSASLIAAIPLLASCASSGLFYMSDDWCASHLNAAAARCPENQTARLPGDDRQEIDTGRSGLASR